jgi:hypothetical protein
MCAARRLPVLDFHMKVAGWNVAAQCGWRALEMAFGCRKIVHKLVAAVELQISYIALLYT